MQTFAQIFFIFFAFFFLYKNILRKTCKYGLDYHTFAGMSTEQPTKQRKTRPMVSKKTGKVYFTAIREPAPKFRGQRFTLKKNGLATTRLWLTQEQYEFAADATKNVARAWGATGKISIPTAIVGAAQISLHVLHGGKFELPVTPTGLLTVSGVSGRRPAFNGGGANVVLTMASHTAKLLSERYEQYCELSGVAELPRTGPVWAAFEHGVQVIREALGK